MKALVTRPREDVAEIAAALQQRGYDAVNEPLLDIRFRDDAKETLPPLLAGAQAVLFTSANGVRAFAQASERRDLAVFAVGDATAKTAREAGFATVESAGGSVADLAGLVRQRLKPGEGALVHAAASEAAGDLAAALAPDGFELRRAALYESVPAERLGDATEAMLRKGEIALALFFSPRTAATFVRLAQAAGIGNALATVDAAVLSPAVADALKPLAWRRVIVAPSPAMPALLHAIDALPKPRRARRSGALIWAIVAVLVVAAAGASAPWWEPALVALLPTSAPAQPNVQQQQQTVELGLRLSQIEAAQRDDEARLQRLETAAKQPPSAAPVQDNGALAALSGRVDANGQSLQSLAARVAALDQKLGTITATATASDKDARLMAAFAALEAALQGSAPFAGELQMVEAMGDPQVNAAVKPLDAEAAAGVPSAALLAVAFESETAPAIRNAAAPAQPAANSSLGARVMAQLQGLVRVRRIGDEEQPDAVAAAAAALGKGDLAAAAAALQSLRGADAAAAAPFLVRLEARIAAQQALAAAASDIAGRIAPQGNP